MSTTQIFRGRAGETAGATSSARQGEERRGRSLLLATAACVVLAALSLLTPSTPTYDPWAWLIWGREIAELDLETTSGPSWKPLPVLFTTLFAPFGDAAPALWLVVARTGALLALVMAYRVASRLVGGGGFGALAGAVAALGLVLTEGWVRYAGLGNSEALLVALVLLAVERHLDGARRHAFVLAFGAALLRPEVWPFLGLYGVYLWRADTRSRRLVAGLLLLVPVLWFGPELWGSGNPLRASSRARNPILGTTSFADRPALEVLRSSGALMVTPVAVGAFVALATSVLSVLRGRRDGPVLALSLAAGAWIAIVAVMTEVGYSGNPRYLILSSALACVLAGVGWTRIVQASGALARLLSPGLMVRIALPVAVALALVVAALPFTDAQASDVREQFTRLSSQAELYENMERAIARAGGRDAVLRCGKVFTGKYRVPVLAWHLGVHLGDVEIHPFPPGVIFYARGAPPLSSSKFPYRTIAQAGSWTVFASCSRQS